MKKISKKSRHSFNVSQTIIILGLGLAAWNNPALFVAPASAESSTIEQAIAPTSLAHATLTQKEVDTISGTKSSPQQTSPTAAAPPSPPPAEGMGTPETLDTSSDHVVSTQDSETTDDGAMPQPPSPLMTPPQEQRQAQSHEKPDLSTTAMAPAPSDQPEPEPVPQAPVPQSYVPAQPSPTAQAPLSMAHATLKSSEIPTSVDNSALAAPASSGTSSPIAHDVAHVDSDLQSAQKLEHPASDSLAQDMAQDAIKEKAVADKDALVPPEDDGIKRETNAQLDQPMQPSSVGNSSDMDPKVIQSWTDKLEILERENIALRDKLQLKDTDKLSDIKVDAVAQIHENVLRDRVAELEKELDKLHMQQDPNNAPDQPKADDLAKAVKGAIPPPPPAGKADAVPQP